MLWIGLLGVVIGAGIVLCSLLIVFKYLERQQTKRRELEYKIKEVEMLQLLNKKINEILSKRNLYHGEYISFDAFDDCYITIDDYIYLQSFAAQNNFYLPTYLIEEFFKNISHHKVVLSPDETARIGGYTYKGGRVIMESFSDQLIELANEKRTQLEKLTKEPLYYFDIQ